ncbi:MAG TPA: TonB-dependent receptor plug domain-containing protein [Steroidobacteraceae bacterium]|nr:TonB-dependent receptor plug domain-containing protein [Steroidobacteraceae bacterium]
MFKTEYPLRACIAAIIACSATHYVLADEPVKPAKKISTADSNANADLDEVVVTGSHISSSGFSQPTPTTMLDETDISKVAEPNIFNTIAQLPSLQGSTGRTVQTNATSTGLQGLSAFSLRGLGAIRTLTLLDGQRVVAANVTGVTDVSQFPQLLIKRVDVVTGGASASYGSDAVGGVVNFITDKKFEGLKINAEYGVTTYGDDQNVTAQLAWGSSFFNSRLHVEFSGEYGREAGVNAYGFGIGGTNGRRWFNSPGIQDRTIAASNDGRPQLLVISNAQQYQVAKYGLITAGPLQGIAFAEDGTPYNFKYGSNGIPTGTGAVTNCYAPFCVGGDTSGIFGNGTSLAAELKRGVAYSRVGFDISDNKEIYVTANYAEVISANTPNAGHWKLGNLTIQCSNPYLPTSIQTDCSTNGITSFRFGTDNAQFTKFINVHPKRRQLRFVLGTDGDFNIGSTKWSYNGYYERGVNHTDIYVKDISLNPRFNAAINATRDANGVIVCADPVAQANGCAPLNIFGNFTPTGAALEYVIPSNGPQQHTWGAEDVFSVNLSGEPFNSWAGPIAMATGLEYRRESYKVHGDPYGAGVSADSPNSSDYPADPVLNSVQGNNWYAGNYHNGSGTYNVKEGYLEFNVPLLASESAGNANLNIAARRTTYSTAGNTTTWKVGSTWQLPFSGLKIRAVTSRDARAPNLSELFAAPTTTNGFVNNNGTTVPILQILVGNTALTPEIARNTEVGIVLAQPEWLPGFNASFDLFNIKIDSAISALGAQQEVDLCNAGNQSMCAQMLLTSPQANGNFVRIQAFNVASIVDKGYDIEVGYRAESGLSLRALLTHTSTFLTTLGVPGTIPVESAGVNTGVTPRWKLLAVEGWDTEKYSVALSQRWISGGVLSNEYIECQTNCPLSTALHQTIDNNHMAGALYYDVSGTYNHSKNLSVFVKIDNLFDHDPAPTPFTGPSYGGNGFLYDLLGRMYRAGIRYTF